MLLWGLFVGGAAAVLAPVGPGALVPLKMAIASADSVGNDVYVAVVVDFGSGSSMSSVSKCVPVASNAHDSDALAAAVGASNVAYNGAGLLCAIDNYPANGVQNCGESVGSGDFDYWSYWHGSSGSWVYANDGPAEHSVSSQGNDVEGWRFQLNQPDNSSDPPPAVAPSYAQICNASTEVPPPAQTPSPAATTTTTTATPTPPPVAPTAGRAGTGPALATKPITAAGARPKSGAPTTKAAPGGITTTTTTTTTRGPGKTASGGGSAGGSARGSDGGGNAQGSSSSHGSIVASAASRNSGGGASSNVLPVILIAVVLAALGGLALFRWRRRPAEE